MEMGNTEKILEENQENGHSVSCMEHNTNPMSKPKATPYLVIKTVCLVLALAVMGLYLELVGPTLPDLMERVNVNFEQISHALVMHSMGYFVSAIAGGFLIDKFPDHVELFLCIAFLLAAVGTSLAPWVHDLRVLSLLLHIRGLSQGYVDTYSNFLCMKMWQSHATAPVHALHFGFGAGAVIAPQLARPFVSTTHLHYNKSSHTYVHDVLEGDQFHLDINGSNHNFGDTSQLDYNTNLVQNMSVGQPSRIEIPYSVSAALAGLVSLIFLFYFIYDVGCSCAKYQDVPQQTNQKTKPQKSKPSFKSMINPGSCTNGDPVFGALFFTLMFLFTFNQVGGENAIGRFLYSFVTEGDLKFSAVQAASLNSVFWISFTCGRALTFVIARWMHPRTMLIIEASLITLCGIILAIWGYKSVIVLWVFSALIGMSLSPIIPAVLAWANRYVTMNGLSLAMIFSGGASGGMFYQWLTGYVFQHYGPHTLLYIILGYALSIALTLVFLQILVCNRSERFQNMELIVSVSEKDEKCLKDLDFQEQKYQEEKLMTGQI